MKTCRGCGETKPYEEFNDSKRGVDGRNPRCKPCVRAYANASYARNKAHLFDTGEVSSVCQNCDQPFTYVKTTGMRRMYCSQRCKHEVSTKYRLARPKPTRKCECGSTEVYQVGKPTCANCRKDKRERKYAQSRRLSLYSLSEEDLAELLASQQGRCGICRTDDPGNRGWQIDHDHGCCPGVGSCGDCVRGLLCSKCNLFLGLADDKPQRLARAQEYLLQKTNLLIIPGEAV